MIFSELNGEVHLSVDGFMFSGESYTAVIVKALFAGIVSVETIDIATTFSGVRATSKKYER